MAAEFRQQGDFLQADFFDNTGGLNLTDSPFRMLDSQANGGYNYDYALTGGIKKRAGHTKLNDTPNAATRIKGMGLHIAADNTKTPIRAALTKIQSFAPSTGTFANLTEDTAAGTQSDFFVSDSTQPVVMSHFDTADSKVLWLTGGGVVSKIWGVYSGTKVTENGSDILDAVGNIGLSAGSTGGSIPTGTYYYAITLTKAATLAESNAGKDLSVSVTAGQKVTIDLSGLTIDTTKYSKINIYRSSVSGVSGFTAGQFIIDVNTGTANYIDDGTGGSADVVPRADSDNDNSVLPSGKTYKVLTTFQRRLVTAADSTLYWSEFNRPEGWPTANTLTIPSGGPITALGVISFTTPTSTDLDELLVIFKEREIWTVKVDADGNYNLKFIDAVGCVTQPLIVQANGYLAWIDYRGIYLWDGSGKPIYCSRPIEALFGQDGDLNKALLTLGWGAFSRRTNQIMWFLSHQVLGEQQYCIKLDLRLTLPAIDTNLGGRVMDGVFIQDSTPFALYAGFPYLPNSTFEELFLAGDGSGFMYSLLSGYDDADEGIQFSYQTKFLDLGMKSTTKRIHKVILWTQNAPQSDLTLSWWTNYRDAVDERSSLTLPASGSNSESLWDIAFWDASYWESTATVYSPVVYNLNSTNGTEGDCIKLEISQTEVDSPVTIAGFTIIYSEMGLRK